MALAIFDLDNTLIANDSDYLWGEFMATNGLVNADEFRQGNEYFFQQYHQGTLDIHEYLEFCLAPLTRFSRAELDIYHARFMTDMIRPVMLEKSETLLNKHRHQGDFLMIITATSSFVTKPIARALGVDTILAIELEIENNQYTGSISGIPTFREGKVLRLQEWLADNPEHSLEGSYFYSDSKNDLPLLNAVTYPFAVDPDPELKKVAIDRDWPVISLR